MILRKLIVVLVIAGVWGPVSAQSVVSPYSNNGIGEVAFQGMPNNYAMGGVGIGSPTIWHINLQNPAYLIYNNFSTFQVGIDSDIRTFTSNQGSYKSTSVGLRVLAMSYPMKKGKWSSSIALLPLSTVNFNTYSRDSVGTALRVNQYQGEGGLSQLVWAHGFRIYKSLSLGIKAAYVFGGITKTSRDQLIGEDVFSNHLVSYVEETSYSDFNFSAALGYRWKVKESNYLNFGVTNQISRELVGERNSYYERQLATGTSIQTLPISEGEEITINLPVSYGFGVSYEKLYNFKVGVDVQKKNWQSSNIESEGTDLRNILDLSLGVEWIPDNQSVDNYLDRATYRLGFSAKQLPYLVNNEEINDFGINFGASFPVSGYSSLDAAFKYGFRGTTQNNLIRENYFQIVIGATINDNQWFIKRRYD